ncbi:hypothetical protein C5167_024203 [Papaver somniferum]|uniref:Uncharacterized protein n=1 Tax=Papaver somniferum TaxID=3469 RepID=A0A4Y7JMY0_PAPSO|nr:hypothetical protein C5167_024203 [Papaver somniferum]
MARNVPRTQIVTIDADIIVAVYVTTSVKVVLLASAVLGLIVVHHIQSKPCLKSILTHLERFQWWLIDVRFEEGVTVVVESQIAASFKNIIGFFCQEAMSDQAFKVFQRRRRLSYATF